MKKKYFGSIAFFKHLIISILVIIYFLPLLIAIYQSNKISKLEKRLDILTTTLYAKKKNSLIKKEKKTRIAKKIAYLTFDDGPSSVTDRILDILKIKNVKATFFVVYHGKDAETVRRLQRIVVEGHTIGLHSYSHKYDIIYSSAESFWNDLDNLKTYIVNNTGYTPNILRFPGGSNCSMLNKNLFYRIKSELDKRGYRYFDWNVSSGDCTGSTLTVNDIVNNCYSITKKCNTAIILMHDTSERKMVVAEALPVIIDKLRRDGFVFSALSTDVPQITFRK